MTKTTIYGPSILDWMTGGPDRENVTEVIAEIKNQGLVKRIDGDVVLCEASPALKRLVRMAEACYIAAAKAHDDVIARDSLNEHKSFHDELDAIVAPAATAMRSLFKAQLQLDLVYAGVDRSKYLGIALADDGNIVGYTTVEVATKASLAIAGFSELGDLLSSLLGRRGTGDGSGTMSV